MIPHAWVEKQVSALPLAELKQILGRQRLRIDRKQIVAYLMALVAQQALLRHYKAIHAREPCGVGYAGFMHGLGLVAPLWRHLEARFREHQGIEFDEITIVDSSLLPTKAEANITRRDWDRGHATVRGSGENRIRICGEKVLTVINGRGHIVYNRLQPAINTPDDHVFKQPMVWATRGLRQGVLLADRGFSNAAVRTGIAFLRKTLPGYTLELISPPRARQTWTLTPQQQALYRKRWAIEETFRQLKDPLGAYRLILAGVRRRGLRAARVAIATLAWNMGRS